MQCFVLCVYCVWSLVKIDKYMMAKESFCKEKYMEEVTENMGINLKHHTHQQLVVNPMLLSLNCAIRC